jgi:pentatricopeptide repeat protein
VIKTFSNNSYNDGASQALMILKKLEKDEYLQPDIITYNSCLNAYAKAKDPIAAQLFLERMENRYAEGHSVKPDTYSYVKKTLSKYYHVNEQPQNLTLSL